MNTTAGPVGDVAPPSSSRWWAIVAGIGVAAVLGYGAALIATDHLPGTTHADTAPVAAVATPQVQSETVSPGAVDPFEAQSASPQAQAAAGVTGLSPQEITQLRGEAMVEYFASQAAVGASGIAAQSYAGADDLATRSAVGVSSIAAQSYAGADDLATRILAQEAVRNAGADDLATRSAAGVSGIAAQSFAGSDDLATRILAQEAVRNAGASGVVAHSALDPFELRSGVASQSGVAAIWGTEFNDPSELYPAVAGSSGQPTVGYVDGQWHIEEIGAKLPSQPAADYFDGQWHAP